MNSEIWKDVVGYEGLYFVSNMGNLKNKNGQPIKSQVVKRPNTNYERVSLYKDGKYQSFGVHRLVAMAFTPNPNGYPIVNHKDENGMNNSVDNLEWCTLTYNVNYGTARQRQREKLIGVKHTEQHKRKISDSLYDFYSNENDIGRKVVCLENGETYNNIRIAARAFGVSEACVRMSCNRQSKKGRRATFRYEDMREDTNDTQNTY